MSTLPATAAPDLIAKHGPYTVRRVGGHFHMEGPGVIKGGVRFGNATDADTWARRCHAAYAAGRDVREWIAAEGVGNVARVEPVAGTGTVRCAAELVAAIEKYLPALAGTGAALGVSVPLDNLKRELAREVRA